jgi:hypothetical protein
VVGGMELDLTVDEARQMPLALSDELVEVAANQRFHAV